MNTIDTKLINARPDTEEANEPFIYQTMTAAQEARSRETFSGLARTKSVNKKEKFMTNLLAMPKAASAALGLGAILITGGSVYAAVNWFGTDVSTRHNADTVYSLSEQCPPSQMQALQGNTNAQENKTQYKILKPEIISEHDLQLDELSTCEQRAIEHGIRTKMSDVYKPGDSHNGLYYPVGAYGKVVSTSGNKITIADVPINHQVGERELATVTLNVHDTTLVANKGEKAETSSFKRGDSVYFIFQNPVRPGQNDNDWRATPSEQSTVRAIAKTQYDMVRIKEKILKAFNEGAVQIIIKSDAYGG